MATEFEFVITEPGTYKLTIEPVPEPPAEVYGAGANDTGQPIGGGQGYTLTPFGGVLVGTKAELVSAITKGEKLIQIHDTAKIDLGKSFEVPDGVTLYGYRGIGGLAGPWLFTATTSGSKSFPFYMLLGAGARLIGLRIQGPDPEESSSNNMMWHGVSMKGSGCVVENCELYGWPYAAISSYLLGVTNRVRFCYIHHNRKTGYGYGTETGKGFMLFEANKYEYNRHDICGLRGTPGTNYEARYNITGVYGKYSRFDCHGSDPGYEGQAGGGTILVHHNTEYNTTEPLFKTRGIPTDIIKCYRNLLPAGRTERQCFEQTVDGKPVPYTKMVVEDNMYGDVIA